MRVKRARRDEPFVIEQRTRTQDPVFGTTIEGGWTTFAEGMAEVQDILAGQTERYGDSIALATRPCRVTTLYIDGVTSDMRVIARGRTMQIVRGPAEIGRREGLEMVCQDVSTEGVRP